MKTSLSLGTMDRADFIDSFTGRMVTRVAAGTGKNDGVYLESVTVH